MLGNLIISVILCLKRPAWKCSAQLLRLGPRNPETATVHATPPQHQDGWGARTSAESQTGSENYPHYLEPQPTTSSGGDCRRPLELCARAILFIRQFATVLCCRSQARGLCWRAVGDHRFISLQPSPLGSERSSHNRHSPRFRDTIQTTPVAPRCFRPKTPKIVCPTPTSLKPDRSPCSPEARKIHS